VVSAVLNVVNGIMTTFECTFWLAAPREKVFSFFADAFNLQTITPDWVHFKVVTPPPIEIRQGTVIEYRLRIRGLPFVWLSEITAWEPTTRFVDEQRRGPYKVWIHEHRFEDRGGGTEVIDRVTYATAGGRLVERFVVGPDLRRIFAYRERRLKQIFAGGE
jgi:ligand-binding SRPBCC domain-containing protein